MGRSLLEHNPRIDEIFVAKGSLFSLWRKLKQRKITHVLSFHTSQRAILPLAAILGGQQVIGSSGMHKGLDALLTDSVPPAGMHEIQRRVAVVAAVGAECQDVSMELFLSDADRAMAEAYLKQIEVLPGVPIVVFHPGSKDRFKQWPASHFIELGNRLNKGLGCKIVVTGNLNEQTLVSGIASQIQGATACTHLPLLAMAALIGQADLMITNDTGPMHLAFAQQTPVICLFTPTDPTLCGPYFVPSAHVVAKKPTCTPCLRKRCREPFCLLQIGIEEVYRAAVLKAGHLQKWRRGS